MKTITKRFIFAALALVIGLSTLLPAVKTQAAVPQTAAVEDTDASADTAVSEAAAEASTVSSKAWAAAVAIAFVAGVGAFSMGLSISKSVESISRQPEAAGSIRTALMLGLVFIETAIIYALIVAILIVFTL